MADNDQLLGEDVNVNPISTVDGADQAPDYLGLLVGEGKKYADQANLAKGYANLDAHTRTLMDEKKALENQLLEMGQKVKTGEDILAAIKGGGGAVEEAYQAPAGANGQDVSQADVAGLIAAALDQRDEKHQAQSQVDQIAANQKTTWDKLSKIYGDKEKAKVAVGMYCGEDAAKRTMVQNLGSTDPDALALIMQNAVKPKGEQVSFGVADASNQASQDAPLPNPAGLFTYAESLVVKKQNPKLYHSRQFQARLHDSCAKHSNFWVGIKGH